MLIRNKDRLAYLTNNERVSNAEKWRENFVSLCNHYLEENSENSLKKK